MANTLFEKYGGFGGVSRLTMSFYELVIDDDLVGHHFDDTDLARLVDHQTRFLSSLLGGPASYSDAHLAEVHRRLAITHAEFDRLVGLICEALDAHGFTAADRDAVRKAFEGRRAVIVTGGEA